MIKISWEQEILKEVSNIQWWLNPDNGSSKFLWIIVNVYPTTRWYTPE